MIKILKHVPENIAAFSASGDITADDFQKVYAKVGEIIEKEGELNYLLKLDTDVKNFSSVAWLKDMMLGVKHLTKWNRCAILSDNGMIKELTDLFNRFTLGDFKVYKHNEFDKAVHWVSTGQREEKKERSNVGNALLAGLGGAVALNILHEVVRKNFDDVPEVNKVGEEALSKGLEGTDIKLNEDQLYGATLAADVVSNALYYSALATNKAGFLSGIAGGIGAVELPKYMGLNDSPVASTSRKKVLTVAYYTFGAVVTGLIYRSLRKK